MEVRGLSWCLYSRVGALVPEVQHRPMRPLRGAAPFRLAVDDCGLALGRGHRGDARGHRSRGYWSAMAGALGLVLPVRPQSSAWRGPQRIIKLRDVVLAASTPHPRPFSPFTGAKGDGPTHTGTPCSGIDFQSRA